MRVSPTPTERKVKDTQNRNVTVGLCAIVAGAAATTGFFVFNPHESEASETPVITTHVDGETVNKCSVTFLSDDVAVTAGHCGPEGAKVRDGDKVVGTITDNYLVDGAGADVALIELDDNYAAEALPDSTTFTCAETPATTDGVTMDGAFSDEQAGAVVSEKVNKEASAFGEKYPVEYVLTDNESERGDSGAPVVTDAGCLAGILNGGNGEYSALTFLPEEVLDAAGL